MYKLTQVPVEVDLSAFAHWLNAQGVIHRITEEGEHQVIWLADAHWQEPVMRALEQYLSDPTIRERMQEASQVQPAAGLRRQAGTFQAPLTLAFILIAVVLTWITGFGAHASVQDFFFVDPSAWPIATMHDRWVALVATLTEGQWWRLITPAFLHFSIMHIAFDAVLFWFLGRQIEQRDGHWVLLVIFLVSALVGNSAQYFLRGPEFGGLSGVVYAMLGYCWIGQMRAPRFYFPPALIAVSVIWMLLGLTPLPQYLGIGAMANGAHAGGFLSGLLLALVIPAPRRR